MRAVGCILLVLRRSLSPLICCRLKLTHSHLRDSLHSLSTLNLARASIPPSGGNLLSHKELFLDRWRPERNLF
jgi:hypothetical protein